MIALLPIIGPIIEKALAFIPDPQQRAKAQLEAQGAIATQEAKLLELMLAQDSKQVDVNIEEAKSTSLFVSGWRPGIAWTCGAAFAWVYVVQPFALFIAAAIGHPVKDLPIIDLAGMMPVLLGILGLSGMRSWEKKTGVQGNH